MVSHSRASGYCLGRTTGRIAVELSLAGVNVSVSRSEGPSVEVRTVCRMSELGRNPDDKAQTVEDVATVVVFGAVYANDFFFRTKNVFFGARTICFN